MNVAGTLTYDTKLDTDGIESGASSISSKAVAIGNVMAGIVKTVANTLVEVGKQAITYDMQLEQYQTALTTLTGSADEANKIMNQIKEDAAKTPFDVSGLTQANQLLISAGVDADSAREDILALGNAIAATGGGDDELSRMAVNLQQIKNVGKASALDIKQFAYAGIDVYGLLADSMGVTREEAAELDVTYEDLTTALKKAASDGGKYAGAMESQSKTLNGQISNLKDNFNSFIGEAAEPVFNFLKDDLLPILNGILDGTIGIDEGITQLADTLLNGLFSLLESLIEQLPEFLDIGLKIIINLINGVTKKIPDLVPLIIDAVLGMVDAILDNLPLIISSGIELIVALAIGIVDAIPDLLEKIPEIITSIVEALTDPEMLQKLISAALQLIIALAGGLIRALPQLMLMSPRIISSLVESFSETISETDWKQLGKNILDGILDGIKNFGTKVKDTAKKLYNEIKDKICDFFSISSPSKKMRDIVGKQIPAGIAVGIEANTDSAINSIDAMNDEIMDKMQNAVNVETGKMAYSGTTGTISQILSSNATFDGNFVVQAEVEEGVLFEAQQRITRQKNLQTGFGG